MIMLDMALDPRLITQAREAGARLTKAEREVLLARADYHTFVRRLHLSGGSLREIAQALDLSHQRVQQMVESAGGSWWQRLRSRATKRDAVCTFCERPPSEVSKLLAGPNVYICGDCVTAGEEAVAVRTLVRGMSIAKPNSRVKCSFCGKPRGATRSVVVSNTANVCNECLGVCRQFMDSPTE
jgi:ClpX C4-type zinc finger